MAAAWGICEEGLCFSQPSSASPLSINREPRPQNYSEIKDLHRDGEEEKKKALQIRRIIRGNGRQKSVALTFDDGPHTDCTPAILSILRRYDAKATFFVVGMMAEKYPQLIKSQLAEGHSIGNHTYSHVNLLNVERRQVYQEIEACGNVIKRITGTAPRLFRPPGGVYDPGVAFSASEMGYYVVLWTDNPGDYRKPGQASSLKRSLEEVENGSIILLHDGSHVTLEALPRILEYLKAKGYRFVTVDEMINGAGPGNGDYESRIKN